MSIISEKEFYPKYIKYFFVVVFLLGFIFMPYYIYSNGSEVQTAIFCYPMSGHGKIHYLTQKQNELLNAFRFGSVALIALIALPFMFWDLKKPFKR
jgi:hypothetical protein